MQLAQLQLIVQLKKFANQTQNTKLTIFNLFLTYVFCCFQINELYNKSHDMDFFYAVDGSIYF